VDECKPLMRGGGAHGQMGQLWRVLSSPWAHGGAVTLAAGAYTRQLVGST